MPHPDLLVDGWIRQFVLNLVRKQTVNFKKVGAGCYVSVLNRLSFSLPTPWLNFGESDDLPGKEICTRHLNM